MTLLYQIAIFLVYYALKVIAWFNPKINLFIKGRAQTFATLKANITDQDRVIWFHCASLGEFEQGRPIIEGCRKLFPNHKIVLSFFSPSGYEVQKNYAFADAVVYLPFDKWFLVNRFLKLVHPELAVMVKYEFWPNLLRALRKQQIHTILVSGIFRENQTFFKWHGTWMRQLLQTFNHFYVQNKQSQSLLQNIDIDQVTLSGDTRFDRVYQITLQDNSLDFVENFVQNQYTLIAGSTWPEDEALLAQYINHHAQSNEKFIIAPHNVTPKHIAHLESLLEVKFTKYSDQIKDNSAQVLIIDTVGILTKIYSYGQTAYVGGGFGEDGVHNVLEPATFGAALVIGPIYNKFQEAVDLVKNKGCSVVNNQEEFNAQLQLLSKNEIIRTNQGNIAKQYILDKKGATKAILSYIQKHLKV